MQSIAREAQSCAASLVLDAAGVAAALGLPDEHNFNTRRRRLELHGFPRPLPMTPLRWSRHLVEAWIAAGGQPPSPPAAEQPIGERRNPTVVALENYRGVA